MKNSTKKFLSLAILIIFVFISVAPFLIQAQTSDNPPSGKIKLENPFKCPNANDCTLYTLINTIISDILIPIGGVVAVIVVMWAGFLYVTARGDTTKIKRAHDALLSAVIGAAILLGAKVISAAIEKTIGQLKV